jgi:RimJ/RimL family protein N-acetyltransferase
VYVDPKRSEFLVNVLIGERDARAKGARTQSREVVYRYFFEDMDLATARASVLSRNTEVLAGMAKRGWIEEHTSHKPDASGEGFVEIRHFRLTRDAWRAKTL